ncbi:MAG TPA: OsmC family protein [Tepidiformaceae bacterium]
MPVRTSEAEWLGNLREGNGQMKLGSGAYEGAYSFGSRFEEGVGSNPEELLGAAHAGCFSMFLAGVLGRAGLNPRRISTTARVHIDNTGGGFSITRIELSTEGDVPGIDEATFQEHAREAKENCPVSKALAVPEVSLEARLL